jgi:serine/threonine protein kinase
LFARKIIRISGTLLKADVQNEAQVVSLILALGGHVNIVNILRHDWLKHSFNQCYYIDMELCEFSLFDYIAHHNNSMKADTPDIAIYNHLSPVIVKRNCSTMQKVQNIWTIGLHIARGLEFMHTHNHAHRDLKPGNGKRDAKQWIDLVVLYSLRDNLWKLADFGLSAKAASTRAYTTIYSRGTSCYRAPELLAEHAAFTNRVDIWALACILHELATGKFAFHQDWAVREYFHSRSDLSISFPPLPSFFEHHLAGSIHDMLRRDWNQRPSASDVCSTFQSYSRLLDLPITDTLSNAKHYPSYSEWKTLARTNPDKIKFLSQISDLFKLKGDTSVANEMRQATMHQDRLDSESPNKSGAAVTEFEQEIVAEKEAYKADVRRCEIAVEEKPETFWPWHNLCQVFLKRKNYDAAIRACKQGNTRFPSNPWPVLALTCVYAAAGEYHHAVSRCMDFFAGNNEELKIPLSEFEDL